MFRPKFNSAKTKAAIKNRLEKVDQAVFLILRRVGEEFVRDARLDGTYEDQTGNLRSSIGFVILKNGEQVYGGFPGETSEGKQTAQQVIKEISGKHTRGYVLIVVAGMSYAAAVEAKGFDVLTFSSARVEERLKELMSKVGKKGSKLTL